MEVISMKKGLVVTKVVSILFLLVSVQAQEFFPSDFSYPEENSLLSQAEYATKLAVQTQQFPFSKQSHYEETSLPSESEFNSNVPVATQQWPLEAESHSKESSSLYSESKFPEDSEEKSVPLETEPHSVIHSLPVSFATTHSENPSSPETPLPKTTPSSPKRPWTPVDACKAKYAAKCITKKVPILHNLCNKVCRKRCIYPFVRVVYNCTNKCAEFMPKNFKSDKRKAAGYVDYCYKKCIKKF